MSDGPVTATIWPLVRRAFTENIGLKAVSLVIAIVLFGTVRGAGTVQRSMEVSLIARLPVPSARRVLLTDLPDKVRVTVHGAGSLVASLRPDEIGPVQIDLSDGHRASVFLDAALFGLPAGVQVETVQPASLQLNWDAFVERAVPVRAAITGTPVAGTRLAGEPEVLPPTIDVSGASLYVEALSSVNTEVIDITRLGPGHYEPRVALEPPRRHVRYDYAGGVRVSFTIEREVLERRFERLPITPVGTLRVELRPPVATVTLRGTAARINGLDPAEIVPVVEVGDGATIARSGTRMPVQLSHVPSDVTLVGIEPNEIIVLPTH